jgi:hypothetical protein
VLWTRRYGADAVRGRATPREREVDAMSVDD